MLPFTLFKVEGKIKSQFSRERFDQFEYFLPIMIEVLESKYLSQSAWVLSNVWHEKRLTKNLVSIFQVRNVSPGKTEKTSNIYDTIKAIFITCLPKWWRCVWPYNSCKSWPRKCPSMSNFTKMTICRLLSRRLLQSATRWVRRRYQTPPHLPGVADVSAYNRRRWCSTRQTDSPHAEPISTSAAQSMSGRFPVGMATMVAMFPVPTSAISMF